MNEPPTLIDRPAAAAATIASSADAMRRDEVSRTRRLGLTGLGLATGVAIALPILGGDPFARAVLIGSLLVLAGANGYLVWLSRDVAHFTTARMWIAWIAGVGAAIGTCYYFGLLSGALAAAMLALYFIGLGGSGRLAVGAFAFFLATQGTLAVLTTFGVIRDRGLLPAAGLPIKIQLVSEALIQGLFAAAFLLARASRRTTAAAVDELERAVRAIAQREAMLTEARQDFARALRIGGAGRWTGERVGGFELGGVIGRGAMGEVYEAGDAVAVKLLHLETALSADQVERFRREAKIAASLDTPHVAKVIEIGDDAAPVPYLAMERLRGTDLAALLRERGRLGLAEVVELIEQIARGLETARVAGIVHRDLKPSNLFCADGVWKILDFGVSKLADSGGTLTAGHVVGTPQYMSPEQAQGGEVDHRSDVYALAAIAYRCLTGRPLYSGADIPALLYQVVHGTPVRPGAIADVLPEVDAVLARALAKRADERTPTALRFAAELALAARS